MSLATYLAAAAGTHRLALHISGCPTLFVDGSSAIVDVEGSAWAAPTDPLGNTYTVSYSLVGRDGVDAQASEWDFRKGTTVGGGATFRVHVPSGGAAETLFASRLTTGHTTYLTHDVDYDAAAATDDRYRLRVESTTGFTAPGGTWRYVHVGRECVGYFAMPATSFGDNTAPNIRRGCYGWQSDSKIDARHTCSVDTYRASVEVADYIRHWGGRRATLLLVPCDEMGRAYDAAWGGASEVEIWSGWVETVRPAADWETWEIVCLPLEAVLRKELGFDSIRGTLASGPGTEPWVWVPDVGTWYNVRFSQAALAWQFADSRVTVEGDGATIATGWMPLADFLNHLAASVTADVNAVYADGVRLYGALAPITGSNGQTSTWEPAVFGASVDPAVKDYQLAITPHPNGGFASILPGWSAAVRFLRGSGETEVWACDPGAWRAGARLPATATSLVMVPEAPDGTGPRTAPATGYARIRSTDDDGNERVEAARYSAVATDTPWTGAWTLTLSHRGVMGTVAHDLWVDAPDAESAGRASAALCWGWEETDLYEILADLLLSSGTSAARHASYDTMPREVGLALDPAALDVTALEACIGDVGQRRNVLFDRARTIEAWLKDEALLTGFVLAGSLDSDGRYRLSPIRLEPPLAHDAGTTLTVTRDPVPDHGPTSGVPIGRIELKAGYDAATGETRGEPHVAVLAADPEQLAEYDVLELEIRGIVGNAHLPLVLQLAERVFYWLGEPYWILTVGATRPALALRPGDIATVTIAGIPTPWGTRGLSSQACVVIRNERRWWSREEGPAALLTLLTSSSFWGLAPSYQIATNAVSGADLVVTFTNNVFTKGGQRSPLGTQPCRDWHFGPQSGETYKVRVWDPGDYAGGIATTCDMDGSGSNSFKLLGQAALGVTNGQTVITFRPYGTVDRHADQDLYAHIADAASPPGLGPGPADAHTWAP